MPPCGVLPLGAIRYAEGGLSTRCRHFGGGRRVRPDGKRVLRCYAALYCSFGGPILMALVHLGRYLRTYRSGFRYTRGSKKNWWYPAYARATRRIRIVVDPDLTEEKLAEFERFFSPLAPMLAAFAERHNLQVEKYRYAQLNWSFYFRIDEEGSRGHLQVQRADDNRVFIAGSRDRLENRSDFADSLPLKGSVTSCCLRTIRNSRKR